MRVFIVSSDEAQLNSRLLPLADPIRVGPLHLPCRQNAKSKQTEPSVRPSCPSQANPVVLPSVYRIHVSCSYPVTYPFPYPSVISVCNHHNRFSYRFKDRSYPTRSQCNIQSPQAQPPYKLNLSALTLSKLPSRLTTPNLKNLSSPPAVRPPTYHFSPPPLPISLNPPPPLPSPSLSLPLLRAAAELAMLDMYPGLVPGDRESGGECRAERADVVGWLWDFGGVMVRGCEG